MAQSRPVLGWSLSSTLQAFRRYPRYTRQRNSTATRRPRKRSGGFPRRPRPDRQPAPACQACYIRFGHLPEREPPCLARMRWGCPHHNSAARGGVEVAEKLRPKGKDLDFSICLLRMEPSCCTTKLRNTNSKLRKRWRQPADRSHVPFTSLREFNREAGGDIWSALPENRPATALAEIAGA